MPRGVKGSGKKAVQKIVEQAEAHHAAPVEKPVEINSTTSTGAFLLDLALGGGYPWGKIVNLVGDNSTGKTLLAIEAIATARKVYGDKLRWHYDDAEAGFSFDTEKLYGFPIVAADEDCSFTTEDFQGQLDRQLEALKGDEYLIYVLDSLDALTSEAEVRRAEEAQKERDKGNVPDKGTYGLEKQKQLGQMFRLLRRKVKEKNCLLIVISQVRVNLDPWSMKKYTRTGGKALDFYAAQIVWLANANKLSKSDRVVGVTIKAKVDKNKIGKPFREAFVSLLFDYGIDDIGTNIDYLFDRLTPQGKPKTGEKKIPWDGKEYTRPLLIRHIEQAGQEGELREMVREKWAAEEAAVASERKSKWDA